MEIVLPTLRRFVKNKYGESVAAELSEVLRESNLIVDVSKKVDLKTFTWNAIYRLDKRFGSNFFNRNKWSEMISNWYSNVSSTIGSLRPRSVRWET